MEKVTIDYKRLCLELEKQGKTKADLSRDMAKNKNFVGLIEKNPDAYPGWNADRKKCKTCRYRQAHNNPTDLNKGNCNYIEIAGHSRGCAVEDCDRYVKGTRMERKRK